MNGYGPLALVLMIALLGVFIVALVLGVRRNRHGRAAHLRPLPGVDAAVSALARAAEAGQPVHLAPGPAGVGESGTGTAATLAGLAIVRGLGQQAARTGAPLLISSGDALTHLLAEDVVQSGYKTAGRAAEAPLIGQVPTQTIEGHEQGVRFLAHRDPLAYAAAASDLIERGGAMQVTTVGGFGPEYLLLGEAAARAGVPTVAGASDPQALATMLISARHTLIGEELYAAGSYLDRRPARLASLQAQDLVRVVVIIMILVGVLLASVLGSDAVAGLLHLF